MRFCMSEILTVIPSPNPYEPSLVAHLLRYVLCHTANSCKQALRKVSAVYDDLLLCGLAHQIASWIMRAVDDNGPGISLDALS